MFSDPFFQTGLLNPNRKTFGNSINLIIIILHTHTHTHVHTKIQILAYLQKDVRIYAPLCIHLHIYEGYSNSIAFFFNTRIIINAGTCIIRQNEAGLLWIAFLLLNIVTVLVNGNVPLSIQNKYPCLLKFS